MRSIAIIGAGFSGTALACTLIEKTAEGSPSRPLKIYLIEKSSFGPGLAYSTDCPALLLNVPANSMSAFFKEPDHFVVWAQKKNKNIGPDTFAPRQFYGEYLRDLLQEAEGKQTPQCLLEKVKGEAIALDRTQDGFSVLLQNGEKIAAEQIVLAMGNYPPAPCVVKESLCAEPLSSEGSVLIIGTGLSMFDQAAKLHYEKYKGTIHALSRHGYLPLPPMSDLKSMFKPHEALPEQNTALAWFRYVRRMIKQQNLQALVNGRIYIEQNWSHFSHGERARYARHLQSYLHLLHHVPQPMQDLVEKLIQNHQLQIHAGKLLSVHKISALKLFTVKDPIKHKKNSS